MKIFYKNISFIMGLRKENNTHIKNACESLNGCFNESEKLIYTKKILEESNIDAISVLAEQKLTIFHTLGKILYNKRIDPDNIDGSPKKLGKFQMLKNPKRYFDLKRVLEISITSYEKFNNYVYDNYIDHFRDTRELSKSADIFSLTDSLYSFKKPINTNEDLRFNSLYLNCEGIMSYNLSQHDKKSEFRKYMKKMANYDLSGRLYKKNLKSVIYYAKTNLPFSQNISNSNFILNLETSLKILKPDVEIGKAKKINVTDVIIGENDYCDDIDDPYDSQKIFNELITAINDVSADNINLFVDLHQNIDYCYFGKRKK
jgi:hypothetical protein